MIDYELQMLSGQVLLFYFHVSFECSAHDRDKHVHHCHENDECSQNKECPSDVELRLVALWEIGIISTDLSQAQQVDVLNCAGEYGVERLVSFFDVVKDNLVSSDQVECVGESCKDKEHDHNKVSDVNQNLFYDVNQRSNLINNLQKVKNSVSVEKTGAHLKLSKPFLGPLLAFSVNLFHVGKVVNTHSDENVDDTEKNISGYHIIEEYWFSFDQFGQTVKFKRIINLFPQNLERNKHRSCGYKNQPELIFLLPVQLNVCLRSSLNILYTVDDFKLTLINPDSAKIQSKLD